MATDARTYLATLVLNEERIVTYRALSRALKIHHNPAKKLLSDFHAQQATRKKGSVHATYLVGGTRKQTTPTGHDSIQTKDADDYCMQSTPFTSSAISHQAATDRSVPVHSIILVQEQDLDTTKAQLEGIDFIHVYSVEPSSLKDLQVLSEEDRQISNKYANEDPLIFGKGYGTIQNGSVKRRTGPRPILPTEPAVLTHQDSSNTVDKLQSAKSQTKDEDSEAGGLTSINCSEDADRRKAAEVPRGKSQKRDRMLNARKPSMQRNQSDIFKSFSKSKSALRKENTDSSLAASPTISAVESPSLSTHEDQPMDDPSEDEQVDDFAIKTERNDSESSTDLKAKREEKLRKMMDEDDDPMNDPEVTRLGNEDDGNLPDTKEGLAENAIEPRAALSGVRRRGRRRVMRKKTVKDEEGYLVTREEQVWESFSEDEPEAYKVKTRPPSSSSAGQEKKSMNKPGQGNIMSFFAKK